MTRIILVLAGVNGLIAVMAGAFGAHGLRNRLSAEALTVFETGARYHVYHALALAAVAAIYGHAPSRMLQASAFATQAGILLFCGSLYALGLSHLQWKWLGPITPLGGGLLMLGWLLIALAGLTHRPSP